MSAKYEKPTERNQWGYLTLEWPDGTRADFADGDEIGRRAVRSPASG